jgi:hypothetical protein
LQTIGTLDGVADMDRDGTIDLTKGAAAQRKRPKTPFATGVNSVKVAPDGLRIEMSAFMRPNSVVQNDSIAWAVVRHGHRHLCRIERVGANEVVVSCRYGTKSTTSAQRAEVKSIFGNAILHFE